MQANNNGSQQELRSPQQIISGENKPATQNINSIFDVSHCPLAHGGRNTSFRASERKRSSRGLEKRNRPSRRTT